MERTYFKQISRWFLPRLALVIFFLFLLNECYVVTLWKKDVLQFSRVKNRIDSAFASGADIYLGESSNTSFNPWTDTLQESISDFLQYYLPERRIEAITHEGYHPGLFKSMLALLPNLQVKGSRTLWLGVNMRTFGPSAMFSGNEASNQREALFYSNRAPLLTRIFMGLHFYDNRNEKERERLKFQWWRIKPLPETSGNLKSQQTAMTWFDEIANNYDSSLPEDLKGMQGAYVKEFAFIIDQDNPRLKDLKQIVEICNQKGWNLIFHVLPPNRYHASWLFQEGDVRNELRSGVKEGKMLASNEVLRERLPPNKLLRIMDQNHSFLVRQFFEWGVSFVDNYYLSEAMLENADAKGAYFTDQWYPTEHYNAVIRSAVAGKLALFILEGDRREFEKRDTVFRDRLRQNNFPNWEIKMPLSDPEHRIKRGDYLPN
jgi:hypothetical protein